MDKGRECWYRKGKAELTIGRSLNLDTRGGDWNLTLLKASGKWEKQNVPNCFTFRSKLLNYPKSWDSLPEGHPGENSLVLLDCHVWEQPSFQQFQEEKVCRHRAADTDWPQFTNIPRDMGREVEINSRETDTKTIQLPMCKHGPISQGRQFRKN